MERRRFLKYTSLGTLSWALNACQGLNFGDSQQEKSPKQSDILTTSGVDFGNLDKTDLNIGFLPVVGAAPIIVAKEKGFFKKYGLNVQLSPYLKWLEIEIALKEYKLDAAQTPYAAPLIAQMGENYSPMISLMVLHNHGSAILLDRTAWNSPLRPVTDYFNFQEFAKDFRQYIRQRNEPFSYGINSFSSNDYYLFRYWLSTMGIRTKTEVEWLEIPSSKMIEKLEEKKINGYCTQAPFSQQGILEKQGFVASVSRNIWEGHPGSILSTMIPWIENYPTTARALTASILEACQFCDISENRQEIGEILAKSAYLNLDVNFIKTALSGVYQYGGFDDKLRENTIKDFYIFYNQNTNGIMKDYPINYPWLSHGIWFLTQLIRWKTIDIKKYPKDADHKLKKVYPIDIYKDVAKALKIKIPTERMKIEPAEAFSDKREFNPEDPVKYLSQFPREL